MSFTTSTLGPDVTTESEGGLDIPLLGITAGVVGGAIIIFIIICAVVCAYCLPKRKKKTAKAKAKKAMKNDVENPPKGLENLAGKTKTVHQNQYVGQKNKEMVGALDHEVPSGSMVAESYINEEVFKSKKKVNPRKVLKKKMRKELKAWEIDQKRLTTKEIIGKGQFGVVYKGLLLDKQFKIRSWVAVKTMAGQVSQKEMSKFLAEALFTRDFDHENVLTMKGVVIKDNQPWVVMPYMANGDLKNYLADSKRNLVIKDLVTFAHHVARGMAYLSSKGFVHRDLAARNCMVSNSLIVKVADFGLSRDVYDTEYYKPEDRSVPLPVRWMAVESLPPKDMKFTTKSDVWSFGILIWELFTRGNTPYPSLDNMSVIKYIQKGERLQPPSHTPPDIAAMMTTCCETNPDKRPVFREISEKLHEVLSADGSGVDYQNIVQGLKGVP